MSDTTLEGFVEPISQHLHGGRRDMRAAPSLKLGRQSILKEELTGVLVMFFGGLEHLVV